MEENLIGGNVSPQKMLEISKIYSKWEDFKVLRKELDPTNKFLNPYLTELLNEKERANAVA